MPPRWIVNSNNVQSDEDRGDPHELVLPLDAGVGAKEVDAKAEKDQDVQAKREGVEEHVEVHGKHNYGMSEMEGQYVSNWA